MARCWSLVAVMACACGPSSGPGDSTQAGSGTTAEAVSSETGSGTAVVPSGSDAGAPSGTSTTTDAIECDAPCESLDAASCAACGCTDLWAYPWEPHPGGGCWADSYFYGCQSSVCFSQTNWFCWEDGYRASIDSICYEYLGGWPEPCEAPPERDYEPCG